MGYLSQDQLANDPDFQARVRACSVQQAEQNYLASADPADAAYAAAIVRMSGPEQVTMFNLCAASPGLADAVDDGAGGIDSGRVSDPEVLAAVQAFWHEAAGAYA